MKLPHNVSYYFVSIPICITASALALIISIHLCYQYIPGQLKKVTSALMVTCVILSCCGCFVETIRFISSLFINPTNLSHSNWINIADDIFHFGGQFLFYLVALTRIKVIFNNTKYRLSIFTIRIYIILILTQLSCNIWYLINNIIQSLFINNNSIKNLPNITIITPMILMTIFSFMVNVGLICLFVIKFRRFLIGEFHFAEQEEKDTMIDILSKFIILFGIAIFTNELFYVSLIINQYKITPCYGWYIFLARCLENFYNIIALYLSRKIGEKLYFKLCLKCHKCVKESRIIKSTIMEIERHAGMERNVELELQSGLQLTPGLHQAIPSGSVQSEEDMELS